ncbi:uncharacterized protein BCR38DRAFT_487244 [Pseudomassariella vexata]|uniref:Uncharacterized protein n=1 Tax=Pseudomassariella vexata TaxID=1141098 RepID=A0A1Y2DQU8_9PEZI|nr:uncharacterized protein BCR38DRAFT_487244 [Pseudomassariella vexata]ORY61486.1 hypothetical protein BCR38DRAFT_487244 [Pseudomassariella vexata]
MATQTARPVTQIPDHAAEKSDLNDSTAKVWVQVPYDPSKYEASHNAKNFLDWEQTWDGLFPMLLIYSVGWVRSSAPPGPDNATYDLMYESRARDQQTKPTAIGKFNSVGVANNHAMAYMDQCTVSPQADMDGKGFTWRLHPNGCLDLMIQEDGEEHKIYVQEQSPESENGP